MRSRAGSATAFNAAASRSEPSALSGAPERGSHPTTGPGGPGGPDSRPWIAVFAGADPILDTILIIIYILAQR